MKYLFFVFFPFTLFSQSTNLKGKIIYDQEIFGTKNTITLLFSPKSSLSRASVNRNKSYKSIQKSGQINTIDIDTTDSYIYVSKKMDSLYFKQSLRTDNSKQTFGYLYEPIPKIKWTTFDEQKKILNIDCKKAVGYFRGRTYKVWYAPSLPMSYGPWKLGGLPGIILEAQDDKFEVFITASKIIIPFEYDDLKLDKTISKVKLDTLFVNEQKKRLNSFLKKLKSRSERGGFQTKVTRRSLELNYDDVNY